VPRKPRLSGRRASLLRFQREIPLIFVISNAFPIDVIVSQSV
jgi:hypothetical protein